MPAVIRLRPRLRYVDLQHKREAMIPASWFLVLFVFPEL